MKAENQQENAALYALDALTPDERAEFLKEVAEDAELAALVVEMRDAAAWVAYSATNVEPPPGLKAQLMRSLADSTSTDQPLRTRNRPTYDHAKPAAPQWIPWALAAGFAIFAGVLWGTGKNSQALTAEVTRQNAVIAEMFARIAELEKSNEEKTGAIADLTQQTVRLSKLQLATLSSPTDAAHLASVLWDASAQKGILQVRTLPAAPAGHDYQLWVIEPGQTAPVSAGVFQIGADGTATFGFEPVRAVSGASKFAVTLEKSGGVPAPEGPLIIAN